MRQWPLVEFETLYNEPSRNGIYKTKEFHGEGVKIVNMGELFGFEFIGPQDMKRVILTGAELDRSKLEEGDLLFGRRSLVEAGAGKCSIVEKLNEPVTFESSIIRIRLNNEQALPQFYYYWFRTYSGRGGIRAIVTGTNVKGIKGSDLKHVMVAKPPLDEQRRIVDIIRNYDDLIENNQRRIQLLEESARLLYKEWFVHLRFPGHESVKVVDGVPKGWMRTTADNSMEVMSGGTPKTQVADYWNGCIPFYTPKDSKDSFYAFDTEKTLTEEGLKNCSSKLYPKNTLFITARGTVGKLNLAQCDMAMNQSCYALKPKLPFTTFFLYCSLDSSINHFKAHASGAVFDAIVVDTFTHIPLLIPTASLINDFTEIVSSVFRQSELLLLQNHKLAQARDLLLPRLMNGEIQV